MVLARLTKITSDARTTRMHSSKIRTARSLTVSRSIQWGGLDADPLPCGCRPPVNRMTHRCKNITLPQTSFAGGRKERAKVLSRMARWWKESNIWSSWAVSQNIEIRESGTRESIWNQMVSLASSSRCNRNVNSPSEPISFKLVRFQKQLVCFYTCLSVILFTADVYPSIHLGADTPAPTPPAQCMLGYTHPCPVHARIQTPLRRSLLRMVRILLECILVHQRFGRNECGAPFSDLPFHNKPMLTWVYEEKFKQGLPEG